MKNNKLWIGLAGLVAVAASFFLLKKNRNAGHEKPPRKAPQLNIENPGSQHDFPKPPMESEIG